MQQLYDAWYRKYGIRRVEQLASPPLPELQRLELPKRSFWHYVGGDIGDMAPHGDDFMFRNMDRPILLGFITELADNKGAPTALPVNVQSAITGYHTRNRRIRKMKALETATKEEQNLGIYSYGLLPRMFRYQRSFYSNYYRWWNSQATVWSKVAEVAEKTDRHQFIVCTLPTVLPTVSNLRKAGGEMTQQLLKLFNDPASLFLLELWKWLGEDRETSVLSRVTPEQMGRVNLIFQESGRWFALNLGILDSWRKTSKKEIAFAKEAGDAAFTPRVKGFEPKQLQLRILKLAMVLFETRSVASAGTDEATGKAAPASKEPERVVTVVDAKAPEFNPATGVFEAKTKQSALQESPEEDAAVAGATSSADDIVHSEDDDAKLEEELAVLELVRQPDSVEHEVDLTPQGIRTPEQGVMEVCDVLADTGSMTAKEYKRYQDLASSYRRIPSPDGVGTLADYIKIDTEVLAIPESPKMVDQRTITDKTMLHSSLLEFDSRYLNKVLHREIAGMVMQFQQAGICVVDYKVERVEQITGDFDSFEVKLAPVEGAPSTFRFKIPAINEDGEWEANCTKYRLRKQVKDLPIRKTDFDTVALTSYYGKMFVTRSTKVVNNYPKWLTNQIRAIGEDDKDMRLTELRSANVFDSSFESPRTYSSLAMTARSFVVRGFTFNFDHTKREELYGADAIAQYEKDGSVLCGKNDKNQMLLMDTGGELYIVEGGVVTEFYPIEQLLELDLNKAPVEFCQVAIGQRDVPVGVILAHELGLTGLCKLLKVQPRRVPAGTRVALEAHEYAIVFADETLVFLRDDAMASMILAGFNDYHAAIRKYPVHEFDRKGVYLSVLDSGNGGARTLRGINNAYRLFVDSITRDLLIEMGEPTDFRGLLLRSTEMLLTDSHPNEMDFEFMRIAGYERIAGHVYSEICKGIREHSSMPGRSRAPIDINPYAVWKSIQTDSAGAQVNDINPVQNLKEQEAITTSGTGGRSGRSMTQKTRRYHPNAKGAISESTVDSQDVAINVFAPGDPQFTSLRGMTRRYVDGKTGATALLSTSALLSPGSDRDDPKRVNFVGIQRSHAVACHGYKALPLRTGYEAAMPHRNSDLFCFAARQDGVVVELTDTGVVVEYKDGTRKGVELGRRYGSSAGLTIPHEVVSPMKMGQKFKAGDIVSYNSDFYEFDFLNPKNVIWKGGVMVNTAIFECTDTLEDSSVISVSVANQMTTRMSKIRTIVLNFDQTVNKLVKLGREVEADDILCIIEDAVTADTGLFDEESLDTLRVLGSHMPSAKTRGVVERIDVFYHGDKEDMSESVRALVNTSDRLLAQRLKARGRKPLTGSVDESFRVEGTPLALDTLAIRIYITGDVPMGVGDKGVFGNQLKTVIGRVMDDTTTAEDGTPIEAIFGYKSISDRIVLSPEIIGTTSTLLEVIGKKAFEIYKGKKA